MSERLSDDLNTILRRQASEMRAEVEAGLFHRPGPGGRIGRIVLHLVGAAAVGVFAAGLSLAVIVLVLNLLFHYSP